MGKCSRAAWLGLGLLPAAAAQQEPIFVVPAVKLSPASAMALGDLDEDGLGEIVLAAPSLPELGIWSTLPDGSLAARGVIAMESDVGSMEVVDLDGDGHVDLIFGHAFELGLLRGAGDGTLAPGKAIAPSPGYSAFISAVVDFNLDGALDVLASHQQFPGPSSWDVLLNQGDGVLHASTSIAKPNGLVRAVGDLQGDGIPDLVAPLPDVNMLRAWVGDGLGGLAGQPAFVAGAWFAGLELLDLDSDGRGDLLTASGVGMAILRNLGHLEFGPAQQLPAIHGKSIRIAADFDEDGRTDVLTGSQSGEVVNLADGQGGLQVAQFTVLSGDEVTPVATFDMNGDGDLDLVTSPGPAAPAFAQVLHGQGNGLFLERRAADSTISYFSSVRVADLDEDGRDDLYLQPAGPGELSLATPGGAFGMPVLTTDGWHVGAMFDTNGDGHVDLVTPDDPVAVRLGDGAAGFGDPIESSTASGSLLETGDIDADGLVDFLSHGFPTVRFYSHLSLGDGTFAKVKTGIDDAKGLEHVLADLDGDGWLDLARTGTSDPAECLLVHRGDGAGLFAPAAGFQPGAPFLRLEACDADLDGLLELVGLREDSGALHILPNDGLGGFGAAAGLEPTGFDLAWSMACGDVTGDGLLDAVLTGSTPAAGTLSAVLAGTGAGGFELDSQFGSATGGGGRLGDFNGDGWLDLLTVDHGEGLTLLLNRRGPWDEHGHGLSGARGKPRQIGVGAPEAGASLGVLLHDAARLSPAFTVLGLSAALLPYRGGVMVPTPELVQGPLLTDGEGDLALVGGWPSPPPGATLWIQVWILDPAGPWGWSASNGLSLRWP